MLSHGHVYHCGLEEYQLQFNLKFSENVLILKMNLNFLKKPPIYDI